MPEAADWTCPLRSPFAAWLPISPPQDAAPALRFVSGRRQPPPHMWWRTELGSAACAGFRGCAVAVEVAQVPAAPLQGAMYPSLILQPLQPPGAAYCLPQEAVEQGLS